MAEIVRYGDTSWWYMDGVESRLLTDEEKDFMREVYELAVQNGLNDIGEDYKLNPVRVSHGGKVYQVEKQTISHGLYIGSKVCFYKTVDGE